MKMPNMNINLPSANIDRMIAQKQNMMKSFFIAIVNVLLTSEGKILFEKSTKVITPAIDLIGKEIIKGIKNNKGKIVEGVKELGKPVVEALRGLLGIVPVVGNAINLFLTVKDVVNAVINGTNLVTATVDNMVLKPLKNVFKPTHQAIIHTMDIQKEFKYIDNDFIKLLKMCNDEWARIQRLESQGINTALMLKNKANFAAAAANADAVIGEDAKKALQEQDKITWCSGGGSMSRRMIENSTNRIRKTIKRFHSLSNDKKSQKKSRRHR
jgi:hypothetical protein